MKRSQNSPPLRRRVHASEDGAIITSSSPPQQGSCVVHPHALSCSLAGVGPRESTGRHHHAAPCAFAAVFVLVLHAHRDNLETGPISETPGPSP